MLAASFFCLLLQTGEETKQKKGLNETKRYLNRAKGGKETHQEKRPTACTASTRGGKQSRTRCTPNLQRHPKYAAVFMKANRQHKRKKRDRRLHPPVSWRFLCSMHAEIGDKRRAQLAEVHKHNYNNRYYVQYIHIYILCSIVMQYKEQRARKVKCLLCL